MSARIGRPAADTEAMTLRLTRDMLTDIDQLRKQEDNPPTRPEMVRRILAQHLDQHRIGRGE